LQESDITTDVFERFLWTAGLPHPDLIIRTGGDHRLSNFLLFQAAYSEICFFDCLWPDITEKNLESAVIYFDNCRKNFGQ
jgi:undecaprenyl diphosphate synthase